jgi:hypothetical protein
VSERQGVRVRTSLLRELVEEPTKNGDLYWRLGTSLVRPPRGPPIWVSEVDWIVSAIKDIADTLVVDEFAPSQRTYPLAFRPSGKHALVILLQRDRLTSELWIERWSAAHKGGSANQEVVFSAYWYCNKPFLPYSRLKIPLTSGWAESLRVFASQWDTQLRRAAAQAWKDFSSADKSLPTKQPPENQIVVAIPTAAGERRISFYPFCPRPRDPSVLPKSLHRVLLEACNVPHTAQQISPRVNFINIDSIRNELAWTARYTDETLREAAFFSPVRVDKSDHLVATLRLPSFLADPLLTSISPLTPAGKSSGQFGPSPQRPEGLPIAELRNGRLIQDHLFRAAVGDYPLPSKNEMENTRSAAKASPRLKQDSRLILQWLDLESRCQVNLIPTDILRRVLGWQRLALLRFDCTTFLADELATDEVAKLVAEAQKRHHSTVVGKLEFAPLLRSRELPQ